MEYVHVRDKATGHEYPVAAHLFNPAAHKRTGKPIRDAHGDLVAPKFRVPLGKRTPAHKQAATKATAQETAAPVVESGQKAETEKE